MLKKCFIFLFPAFSLFAKTPTYAPPVIPQTTAPINIEAKDFSHLLGHLKGIDDDLLKMHFTLYNGYVKNASSLLTSLIQMRQNGKDTTLEYGALERRYIWEFDGMILHELYFENLGPKPFLDQKDPLLLKMTVDFGSFEQWKKNFVATGLIRGVGWVILYQSPKTGHLNNIWVDEHNINLVPGGKPILIMDVWEHAYITEYGLDRAGYIEAFMQNIDWEVVSKRFNDMESSK
jgi:Fe-Mn family superoxide dismutase